MLWLEAFNAGDEPALTSFHAKHTTADLAYGFGESVEDGVRCSGHAGGAGGMNGELQICSSGYTIAVLANTY